MWQQPSVSIYRNSEGFEKCWKSRFREIDKIRKIAVFWTILFSKVEKKELTEIYLTVMYHYCTLHNKSKIV